MKFSSSIALTVLGFAAHAFAAPTVSERAGNPIQVLQADVAALQTAITGDLNSITTAIANSAGDVTAQVQLIANVNADLADIVNQINAATNEIITATTGAVTTLNPVDVQKLIAILQSVQALVNNLQASIQNGFKNLPAQTQAAIAAEIRAVQNALAALQAPLLTYAGQVQTAVTSTGASDPGIATVIGSVLNAINSLLGNLGLGGATTVAPLK